jgi:hypothetical protein
MYVIVAILTAFLLPFFILKRGGRKATAWIASCLVVPAFVLFAEFALPYSGGGASMWPVALVFGGLWSAVPGALGTLIAARIRKNEEQHDV